MMQASLKPPRGQAYHDPNINLLLGLYFVLVYFILTPCVHVFFSLNHLTTFAFALEKKTLVILFPEFQMSHVVHSNKLFFLFLGNFLRHVPTKHIQILDIIYCID